MYSAERARNAGKAHRTGGRAVAERALSGGGRTLAVALLCLAPITTTAQRLETTDDIGRRVTLDQPARRIIGLAPHITENLFAAGLGDLAVGRTSHSDYPGAAQGLQSIGGYHNINTELILSLQPDLVIAWKEGNQFHQVKRLEELGLVVYVNEPRRLEDIARDLGNFVRLAGREATQAHRAAQSFLEELARLREQYAGRERLSVFYQVWDSPLITVTDRQIIGSVIRLCGGANIFADLAPLTPRVSLEAVLAANPQVIISGGMTDNRPDWLDDWRRRPSLRAAAAGNLFAVNPDLLQRYSPRVLLGARQVCEALQTARHRQARRRPQPAP